MSVDERKRHALHGKLDEVLGEEEAATLMSHLPPVGWADVATKQDLDALRRDLENVIKREVAGVRAELHSELGQLRESHAEAISSSTRTFTIATVGSVLGSVLTTASLAFAAARFI